VPSASSHRLKLTPGHRRSTSLSTGSAEDTSSADSRTSTTSPPDSPRCNEETQITTTIEYSSPTGSRRQDTLNSQPLALMAAALDLVAPFLTRLVSRG
jgi:hypothetical protein